VGNQDVLYALHAKSQANQLVLATFTTVYQEIITFQPHQLAAWIAGFGGSGRRCAQYSNFK
jgi:hypothetical protein